jgi:hypothetical protein
MIEEEQGLPNAEEEADQEGLEQQEDVAIEMEEDVAAEQPAARRRTGWTVVGVVAAVLALCTIVACIAAAITAFSGGEEEPTAPPAVAIPTKAPVPTAAPGQAWIVITEPDQGQVVEIDQPIRVQGKGGVLTEGNVVVEALDWQGNVLDRQAATLQGPEVATGGEGDWSVELNIDAEPGTAGTIRAYHPSPLDGSIVAEDSVEVSLGRTEAKTPYIKIEEPAQGALLDISRPVTVRGSGGALTEGNVVVEALDAGGNVLDQQPATLQGPDVGTGGEGTWSVELAVPVSGQAPGYIAAFSTSPRQRDFVASDHVEVTFSGEYMLEGTTWLLDKTIPGSEITALFSNGQVSGSAGCNTYQGTYRSTRAAGGNTIEFGPLATTRMTCDEALMEQEQIYLAALESATEYTLEGFALTITYPGGTLLFYDKDGPRPRR